MMQKEKLYAKIGELTIQFATLEHRLQSLLKILIGENSTLVGPFFIHELNLFVLLRKVGQIARYQLRDDDDLLENLEPLGVVRGAAARQDQTAIQVLLDQPVGLDHARPSGVRDHRHDFNPRFRRGCRR